MKPEISHFRCNYDEVLERISQIDARDYDKTRNHLNGAVSWLSPFISHGVIDTTTVAESLLTRYSPKSCYRYLYELAWREYFHRTWKNRGDEIFSDLLNAQDVGNELIPSAIQQAKTGVDVLDECLTQLIDHGTLHNHARMWIAGITCNTAQTRWQEPARWMHYHLLDGDLASNTLSWQWVAGTFSHKKYIANQNNLNKYSGGTQTDTWLDCSYEDLANMSVPEILTSRDEWNPPETDWASVMNANALHPMSGDVAIHSIWNLDRQWESNIKQHILFLDVEFFRQWPLSPNRWQLIKHWVPEDVKVFAGTIDELKSACINASPIYREYPACQGWPGKQTPRRWLYPDPEDSYKSFSQFWKQVKKHVEL